MSAFGWSDQSVREALGLGRATPAGVEIRYDRICTDTRTLREGDLYVALVGDRFDGHDFTAAALASGARGAVVSRDDLKVAGGRLYRVPDTLTALGGLAAYRRAHLSVPVVAITGSSGKTGTKDFTAAALADSLNVHATAANLNNRVGMPLTLLATPDEAEAVVVELGSNEPGEIAAMTGVARPDVGVVTTVGESHLEKLGSVRGVLEEKLALLRGLPAGGTGVVGDSSPDLARAARRACSHVRVAGWSADADEDLRPEGARQDADGSFRFDWRGHPVALRVPGRHAVANALLALCVSELLGVPPARAAHGISRVESGGMRGEVRRLGGLTVLVDCYNANPQSVEAALDLLQSRTRDERQVAVLGTMLELGAASDALHERVLTSVLTRDVDLVVATGAFGEAARRMELDSANGRILVAEGWREAYPGLRDRLLGEEVVLLKASRGVAMEGILHLLERDFPGRGGAPEGV